MKYGISGLDDSKLQHIANSVMTFGEKLSEFIEAGFDDDDLIQFKDIEVNVTKLNDKDINKDSITTLDLNTHQNMLNVTSYTNCTVAFCSYIIGKGTSIFNQSLFEDFVSVKLRNYFTDNVNAAGTASDIGFSVIWRSPSALSFQSLVQVEEVDVVPIIIGGCVLTACLLILTAILCVNEMKKRRLWREALQIRNGLIVSIAIGEYGNMPRKRDVRGTLTNLPVGSDVQNLRSLADFLNFSFLTVPGKMSWTKDEVTDFVKHDIPRAFFDENGDARFDGLIVSISSHGLGNNVISSDYKKVSRTMIHRIISDRYPEIREIPRIFMFDACDGARERKATAELTNEEGVNKKGSLARQQSRTDTEWTAETKNPDYNTVVVHGANDGFVSLMKTNHVGSYLTYFFVKAVKQRIQRQERKGLEQLLTDIQNALHDSGKQLIRKEFFNNTATLRIEKNHKKQTVDLLSDDDDMVEMVESPTSATPMDFPGTAGDSHDAVLSDSELSGN